MAQTQASICRGREYFSSKISAQTGIGRGDKRAAGCRPNDSWAHAIHHVGQGHLSCGFNDNHRTTVPTPKTNTRIIGKVWQRSGFRKAIPDAEPQRDTQHQVDAVGLLIENHLYRVGRKETNADLRVRVYQITLDASVPMGPTICSYAAVESSSIRPRLPFIRVLMRLAKPTSLCRSIGFTE